MHLGDAILVLEEAATSKSEAFEHYLHRCLRFQEIK